MHGAGKWVDGWSVRGCRSQENAQDGEVDPTDRVLRVRGIGGSNVKQQPHELERQLRAERERERESKQQCAGSNNNKKSHQAIRASEECVDATQQGTRDRTVKRVLLRHANGRAARQTRPTWPSWERDCSMR